MSDSSFLASEFAPVAPSEAHFLVLPVPLERSVSYGTGTRRGPSALLAASQQLERDIAGIEAGSYGIATLPPLTCEGEISRVLDRCAAILSPHVRAGRIPVVLGGEHTVSLGALRAFRPPLPGLIQFDAHADLRERYEGDPYSHASVMYRALEMGYRLVQFGVRELSAEDRLARERFSVLFHDADDIADAGLPQPILPADFPETVYITFDVDCFDASLMPATGTPSPGGLFWQDVRRILLAIARERCIVGFDVVELAPIPALHSAAYTAAKLTYLLMALSLQSSVHP